MAEGLIKRLILVEASYTSSLIGAIVIHRQQELLDLKGRGDKGEALEYVTRGTFAWREAVRVYVNMRPQLHYAHMEWQARVLTSLHGHIHFTPVWPT